MIGPRTGHLLYYPANFLLTLLLALVAPGESIAQEPAISGPAKVPLRQVSHLVLDPGALQLDRLKEYLDLRLPSTKVLGHAAAGRFGVEKSDLHNRLTARARIFERENYWVFELRLSDGRFFQREIESNGGRVIDTRAVATALANLISAIEAGQSELSTTQSTPVTNDGDAKKDTEANIGPVPVQSVRNQKPDKSDRESRPFQSPRNESKSKTRIRSSNEKDGSTSDRHTKQLAESRVEFSLAPVVLLGIKEPATMVRGLGLHLGASFRLKSNAWVALGSRMSLAYSGTGSNAVLLRELISAEAGFVFWNRTNFQLPLGLGMTVEPWWVWDQKRRVEVLTVGSERPSAFLLGAVLGIYPGFQVVHRLAKKLRVQIQIPIRVHLSGEARRGFRAPVIKRELQASPLFRLGGPEVSLALQIRCAWSLPAS